MYRHTFTPGDVPDDGFSADGVAALCPISKEVVYAFDQNDRVLALFVLRLLGLLNWRRGGRFFRERLGRQFGENLASGEFPPTEGRLKVFYLGAAVIAGYRLHLGARDAAEGHTETPRFAFNEFL